MKKDQSRILNSCAVLAAVLSSCGAAGYNGNVAGDDKAGDVAGDGTPMSDSRMNVVFILADDLGYGDLGCMASVMRIAVVYPRESVRAANSARDGQRCR